MSKLELNLERLTECRKKMGLSKLETAKRIGVSQPAYLRYESGERTPSIQVVNAIADVLHTSANYLLGTSDSDAIVSYVIDSEKNPELFAIVEKYIDSDKEQLSRLRTYIEDFK